MDNYNSMPGNKYDKGLITFLKPRLAHFAYFLRGPRPESSFFFRTFTKNLRFF